MRRQKTGKRRGTSGEGGRERKERGRQRERGRENEAREGEGKRDMQMSARLRRGSKSQRNGVGVGNLRGQRDREQKKENKQTVSYIIMHSSLPPHHTNALKLGSNHSCPRKLLLVQLPKGVKMDVNLK